MNSALPNALLFVGPGCPHCSTMLQQLGELLKEGAIARLEVENAALAPERARELGVRSVPWTRLGAYEFEGTVPLGELRRHTAEPESVEVLAGYWAGQLVGGRRAVVERMARERPERLSALVALLENPATSMAVRIGVGAVLEELQGERLARLIVHGLGRLTQAAEANTRADACHYLSLTGSADAIPYLEGCRDDPDPDVREIARESLETLRNRQPG
jgi:hypothetical protein